MLKWVALAVAGWLLLSLVLFLVSAQLQDGVSDDAERALVRAAAACSAAATSSCSAPTRAPATRSTRAPGGPSRADTIMLVHAELGGVRKLSIPRDTEAEIPGHGSRKINAAYALGGPALTIETVENFLGNGLKINHLVEVDFKDFPALHRRARRHHGQQQDPHLLAAVRQLLEGAALPQGRDRPRTARSALGYARVRKNPCAPAEDDRARAARQQEVLRAIGAQAKSPSTFFRLPWVSWQAPKALKTDMRGLALMGLFADVATGNSDETDVLERHLLRPRGRHPGRRPARAPRRSTGCSTAASRRGRRLELRRGLGVSTDFESDDFESDFDSEDFDSDCDSGRRRGPRLLLAVVGVVEAGALEVDRDRVEDPLHGRAADRAAR